MVVVETPLIRPCVLEQLLTLINSPPTLVEVSVGEGFDYRTLTDQLQREVPTISSVKVCRPASYNMELDNQQLLDVYRKQYERSLSDREEVLQHSLRQTPAGSEPQPRTPYVSVVKAEWIFTKGTSFDADAFLNRTSITFTPLELRISRGNYEPPFLSKLHASMPQFGLCIQETTSIKEYARGPGDSFGSVEPFQIGGDQPEDPCPSCPTKDQFPSD